MYKVQNTAKALFGIERDFGVNELLQATHPLSEHIGEEQRLKTALKRAVNREKASQWLVNSIREKIRG